MLKIDILQDEELQEAVKIFISSLLPHENYDSTYFIRNLEVIFKYIKLEEFQMEYRLLLSALSNLKRLCVSFQDYKPQLTLETFESLLEVSIGEAVMDHSLGVTEWLAYEGLESNLENEMVKDTACQKLFQRCEDLYNDCFEMAISSTDVLDREPELRAAFLATIGQQSVNTQVSIIRSGTRIGRKKLNGFDDWLQYTSQMATEIKRRLDDSDGDNRISVDSVENSTKLLSQLNEYCVPIAKWGIDPLDDYTPILKHRLVVVVANENIGKTKFCVDKATNVLLEGKSVAYMCGESSPAKVYSDILINYIWKKYDIGVTADYLVDPSECPDEVQKAIGMSIDELITEGRLTLCESFSYDTVYSELVDLYNQRAFDCLVIDHSCALSGTVGTGSMKDKVDSLAINLRIFKKAYPVCILVASHPSVTAKDALTRGKAITQSPTKDSQTLSNEADEVFILRDNETLQKQELLILQNYKRRDAARVLDDIYLRKRFEVSALIYDESQQALDSVMNLSRQQAIADLMADSDESGYDLD